MNVWLLHIGEELPVDGTPRKFRYGYLAQQLLKHGHQVLRWAPTFRHTTKVHRFPTDTRVKITDGYEIQFVHSPGYRRNTSIVRLQTYRALKRRFCQLASRETPPDVIVSAIPSLEWANAAVDYGHAHAIPAVLDIRDLWPDVFPSALPAWARPAGRLLLAPYYRMARRACRKADGLTAVSGSYLDWALRLAERKPGPRDSVFPLGYEPEPIPADRMQSLVAELRSRGIDPERPVCFFAGALERHHDIETVIDAAQRLEGSACGDLQFVICGGGSKAESLQNQARQLRNVHFLGWVDGATLQAVASISVIGLGAYAKGALMSLGNKPFEYMAGRLAIVSSLPGELADLLARHQCGVTYRAGDGSSLAEALSELVSDPSRLDAMRDNSYQTWLTHYRSRDVYARFVHHLTTLRPVARAA